uniref:Uncharacterized protein n=1 Tax=Alexandrium monilatum TaxID=311494 RepID=A0A7S4R549_9DINO
MAGRDPAEVVLDGPGLAARPWAAAAEPAAARRLLSPQTRELLLRATSTGFRLGNQASRALPAPGGPDRDAAPPPAVPSAACRPVRRSLVPRTTEFEPQSLPSSAHTDSTEEERSRESTSTFEGRRMGLEASPTRPATSPPTGALRGRFVSTEMCPATVPSRSPRFCIATGQAAAEEASRRRKGCDCRRPLLRAMPASQGRWARAPRLPERTPGPETRQAESPRMLLHGRHLPLKGISAVGEHAPGCVDSARWHSMMEQLSSSIRSENSEAAGLGRDQPRSSLHVQAGPSAEGARRSTPVASPRGTQHRAHSTWAERTRPGNLNMPKELRKFLSRLNTPPCAKDPEDIAALPNEASEESNSQSLSDESTEAAISDRQLEEVGVQVDLEPSQSSGTVPFMASPPRPDTSNGPSPTESRRMVLVHRCDPGQLDLSGWGHSARDHRLIRELRYLSQVRARFPGSVEPGCALAFGQAPWSARSRARWMARFEGPSR